jgi:hypothetical protein
MEVRMNLNYIMSLADDALGALDCGLIEITRERLECIVNALQSLKVSVPANPQSEYLGHKWE